MKKFKLIWIVYALMLIVTVWSASAVNLSNGLVSYWKFDETSGTLGMDDLKVYNLTHSNSAITNASGLINKGLNFNGNTHYTVASDKVTTLGAKSFSFWIYYQTSDSTQYIFTNDGTALSNHGFNSYITTGHKVSFGSARGVAGSPRFVITSTHNLNQNEWNQIVLTWDGTTNSNGVKIYINDVLSAQGTASHTETTNPSLNFLIGRFQTGFSTETLNSRIDEFGVYNRVLNSTEVNYLYELQSTNNSACAQYPDFNCTSPPPPPDYFSVSAKDVKLNSAISNFSVNVTFNGSTATYNTTNGSVVTNIEVDNLSLADLLFFDVDSRFNNLLFIGVNVSGVYDAQINTNPRIRVFDVENNQINDFNLTAYSTVELPASVVFSVEVDDEFYYDWNFFNNFNFLRFSKNGWFSKDLMTSSTSMSVNNDYDFLDVYQSIVNITSQSFITNSVSTDLLVFDERDSYILTERAFSDVSTSSGTTFLLSRIVPVNVMFPDVFGGAYVQELIIEHSSSNADPSRCSEVFARFIYDDDSEWDSPVDRRCTTTYGDYIINDFVDKRVISIEIYNRNTVSGYSGRVRNVDVSIYDEEYDLGREGLLLLNDEYDFLILRPNYYATNLTFTPPIGVSTSTVNHYDSKVTVNLKEITTGSVINNFTGWVSNSVYGFNQSFSSTTGTKTVPIAKGLNYTLFIDAEGYALFEHTLSFLAQNTSQSYEFSLYKTNSIDLAFRDDISKQLINGSEIRFEMISTLQSLNYTTTNGTLNLTFLVPETYTLRFYAENYSDGFYKITVADRSYNTLNLYMSNASEVDPVTVTIIDESAKPVEGLVVKSLKYDLVSNSYLVQDIKDTDFLGQVIFDIRKGQEFYRFIIEKDGVMLRMTNPSYINSDALTIQVITTTLVGGEYFDTLRITSALTYNALTNNFRAEYNDAANIGSGYCLKVSTIGRTKTFINSTCSSSASGVLLLNYVVEENKIYEAELYIINGAVISVDKFTLDNTSAFDSGTLGLVIQILLTLFFAMAFFFNPNIGIIMVPVSLLLGRLLGLTTLSWVAITPLIIIAVIIVFINNRGR